MEAILYNQKAENIGKIDLPSDIFGLKMNEDLLYQVVMSLQSNQRQVLAHAKSRSEVRGGGRKPWRQKGTGRARHGSIRSPLWKGGGVTFGPTKERNFKKKINKKMARKALLVALSSKLKDGQAVFLDDLKIEQPKTKEVVVILNNISKLFKDDKVKNTLFITPSLNKDFKIASNNLKKVNVAEAKNLNSLKVISYERLVILKDAVDVFKNTFIKN